MSKDSCPTKNMNCLLSRNGFQPYQRCDYCTLHAHQCMGMQQNAFVFLITFFTAMFMYIQDPLLVKANLVLVVSLLFYLGAKISINTDELAQKESENRELYIKMQNYNFTLEQEVKKRTFELSKIAEVDSITGLLNRRSFDKALEIILEDMNEQSKGHVLVYLDLDQFKIVNDTCGHGAGDELLAQIALLMKKYIYEGDILARLGGDEFGIVFKNTSIQRAKHTSEKILKGIGEYRFFWKGKTFSIGASLGLVEIKGSAYNLSELMAMADTACYAAKDAGRNRIHISTIDDKTMALKTEQMQWINRLEIALAKNRFELFIQPIEGLMAKNAIKHYEVLLRLREEDKLIAPMAFIPAAERYGFINKIDRWVVTHTFAKLSKLIIKGKKVSLSINLSGASLSNNTFMKFIKEQFTLYRLPYEYITFEVTETAAITSLEEAQKFISTFRALGCKFSLDDFGCGLSSFSYLQNLKIDYLKIDGSFVVDIDKNIINRSMVESINSIGHVMKIETVCEYVENREVLNILKELGVDYAQGYFVGKPRPISSLG